MRSTIFSMAARWSCARAAHHHDGDGGGGWPRPLAVRQGVPLHPRSTLRWRARSGCRRAARRAALPTFAVAISVSTRAIGALPVFAFMVIPPAVALLLADKSGRCLPSRSPLRHWRFGRLLRVVSLEFSYGRVDGRAVFALPRSGVTAAAPQGTDDARTGVAGRARSGPRLRAGADGAADDDISGAETPKAGRIDGDEAEIPARRIRQAAQRQSERGPQAAIAAPRRPRQAAGRRITRGLSSRSMNPDLTAIVDFAGGYFFASPDGQRGGSYGSTGFNAQEVEVALRR